MKQLTFRPGEVIDGMVKLGRVFFVGLSLLCASVPSHSGDGEKITFAKPATPIEPIAGILDAFKSHDIVALSEGDHGNEQGHALRLALIRDRRFPAVVDDIVVEFGNALYQDVMDRFVRGEIVADKELKQVWQNTTQPHTIWDRPIYEEFFRAVRTVNTNLPKGRQLRVLLGDPPVNWDEVKVRRDIPKFGDRDSYPAGLIRKEVLAKKHRALIIYGGMHYLRKNVWLPQNDKQAAEKMFNAPTGSLVDILEREGGAKVFSIWTHSYGDLTALQTDIASWHPPALVLIHNTNWGLARFFSFYPTDGATLLQVMPDGHTEVLAADPERVPSMEQQVDAVLYLGQPEKLTFSKLSAGLCADPGYIQMRSQRMALERPTKPPPPGMPPFDATQALKRECAQAISK